ncbi:hypothetical protein TGRH88_084310 [Toxoplasma gondii]|uniref:Uncharacterized protein n=1 Tax=Toxoplasma gondii TaxID=5811 RepID=A0A7J6KHB2_TOXGO|nr:hypothetical protein TGRH88_084310 [Toxoplasma gondii]
MPMLKYQDNEHGWACQGSGSAADLGKVARDLAAEDYLTNSLDSPSEGRATRRRRYGVRKSMLIKTGCGGQGAHSMFGMEGYQARQTVDSPD